MVEHQPSKLDTWVRFPSPAFFYAIDYGDEKRALKRKKSFQSSFFIETLLYFQIGSVRSSFGSRIR